MTDGKFPNYDTLRMATRHAILGGALRSASADESAGEPELPLRHVWRALYDAELYGDGREPQHEPRTPAQRETHDAVNQLAQTFHGSINALTEYAMLQACGMRCWGEMNKHITFLQTAFTQAKNDPRLPQGLRDAIDVQEITDAATKATTDMQTAATNAGLYPGAGKSLIYGKVAKPVREAMKSYAPKLDGENAPPLINGLIDAIHAVGRSRLSDEERHAKGVVEQEINDTLDSVTRQVLMRTCGIGTYANATLNVVAERARVYKRDFVPEALQSTILDTALKTQTDDIINAGREACVAAGLEDRTAMATYYKGPDRASLVSAPSKSQAERG